MPAGQKRNYVSPNSTTVSVTINLVNGAPPPSYVTRQVVENLVFSGAGQNCTVDGSGLATCAITIPAPPGNVNYTIATYATLPVASPGPSPGPSVPTILDSGTETVAIAQGVNNQVTITLEGVVKSAFVTLATPLFPNTVSSSTMTLVAKDASGAVITGTKPFLSPFKLTDGDKYGPNNPALYPYSTFLTVNGPPAGKVIQIASPLDVITMTDNGVAQAQFNINASGPGAAGQVQGVSTITLGAYPIVLPSPVFIDDAAHGGSPSDPNYNQNTLLVPLAGGTVSITPSELGYTNAPYANCSGPHDAYTCLALGDLGSIYAPCNDAPAPVASFNPGPPGQLGTAGQPPDYTYTITPVQPGLCLQQFVDDVAPAHEPAPFGNPLVNGELWVKVQ